MATIVDTRIADIFFFLWLYKKVKQEKYSCLLHTILVSIPNVLLVLVLFNFFLQLREMAILVISRDTKLNYYFIDVKEV